MFPVNRMGGVGVIWPIAAEMVTRSCPVQMNAEHSFDPINKCILRSFSELARWPNGVLRRSHLAGGGNR